MTRPATDLEIVDLALANATINVWNRLAVSLRAEPGTYKVQKAA